MKNPFSAGMVNRLARQCGFTTRAARGIDALAWCQLLVRAAAMNAPSLAQLGALFDSVSAAAVWKRLRRGGVELLQSLFVQLSLQGHGRGPRLWKGGRILVQDSTVVRLPESCRARYPGARNQKGSNPQARLQCGLDLLAGQLVFARLDGFRRNDQAAAGDLLGHARRGDLLVRDLGYQSLSCWRHYVEAGIELLSRLRFGLLLHDPESGERVRLKRLLRAGHSLDVTLLAGEARVPVRVVAVPLSAQHAAHRRRMARRDRDARLAHSREYYHLLGWAIFITSVPATRLSVAAIAALYRLRWRIEIVFKAAKSHLWTRKLPARASLAMVEALLWARLILCWLLLSWHRTLTRPGQAAPSLLRCAQLFGAILERLLPLPKLSRQTCRAFARHRKRSKPGFPERLADFFDALA